MRPKAFLIAGWMLVALAGCVACGTAPDPALLFAEAERLRSAYEKQAGVLATVKYREALAGWRRRADIRAAARAGQRLAGMFEQLGALQESLHASIDALELSQRSRDLLLESDVRSDVGVAYARLGDIDRAKSQCVAALDLARQRSGVREQARALNCLGEAEYHRGDSVAALEFYRQARRTWAGLGDRRALAESFFLEGSALSDINDLEGASRSLRSALSLWREVGDQRGSALTLLGLARLEYLPGQFQEALNRLTDLQNRFQGAGDLVWEAACLSTIANIHERLGEWSAALGRWQQASGLFEQTGLQMAAMETFLKVGSGYLRNEPATALAWFEKARELSERSGNQHMQSWALRYIGLGHLARGNPATALRYLERSLDAQRSIGDPRFRARTLADVGTAHRTLGDGRRAVRFFNQALELSRASMDRVGEATALYGLARASDAQNDLDGATRYIDSALAVAESLRTAVDNKDLRAAYFASVHEYHELQVDLLMRRRNAGGRERRALAAFEASERARARSLLDSLAEAGVDLRAGVDPALLKREQALDLAFEDWGRRHRHAASQAADSVDARALAREYRSLDDRHSQLQAEIRSRSPRYAGLAQPQPLNLHDVQTQVLDGDTLLLEYALGENRSFLWAVSKNAYTSHELPPRGDIERAARRVYQLLSARAAGTDTRNGQEAEQADAEYWSSAARLSDMILAPVSGQMPGKRILVVADGALQYLPFATLPAPRRVPPVPLLVEHEVVSLPSASALALLREETRNRTSPPNAVVVLADPVFEADDPRLPAVAGSPERGSAVSAPLVEARAAWARRLLRGDGQAGVPRLASTREEADAVAAAVPRGLAWKATDFEASRATVLSADLARFRIVHFATHGVFDAEDPGRTGLVLSLFDSRGRPQDGMLRLRDIYRLNLQAELVILSACNTALGKALEGEGLVGIVRGFMYAGARRVVASHWRVDDDATAELMRRFYQEMFTFNRPPAAALRRAQLSIRQQGPWQAPFFWGAFVLQGEYR